MKLSRSICLRIVKNISKSNYNYEPLNYEKWVEYININSNIFIWYENTPEGQKTLQSINDFPIEYRERILLSLNKLLCFMDFSPKKGYHNINIAFNPEDNWILIGFERKPTKKDLTFFLQMAKYLDALLVLGDRKIIDEKVLAALED